MLSPRDHELAEIRQHEAQIVSLLDEQKMHQRQYEQMHQRQQQRLDDQARIFHRDRLALEEQQQALLQKLQAQEERSRQIEKELERGSTNKRSRGRKTRRPVNSSESQNLSDGIEGEDIAESVTDEVDAVPMRVRTKAAKEVHKASAKSLQDSEAYKLTQGRLQLLESEKSALGELNSSLQQENKALKQLATSLQKGPGGPSLILQQQVKDLQQENKHLRQTVHRLNVELSRYQAKYRPVLFEEVEGMALPRSGEPAPWLVNTRLLAPLFLAYDDRLKEKEEIIKTYDEELTSFKGRVNEVVKENQELHMRLSKSKPEALELDQWQQLQEQARLVVEENALLMEQQDIQEHKLKEMQRLHGQEVSKLSKRISKLESEKRRMQTEMDDLTRNHSNLMHQYEAVAAENGKKISMEDHVIALDEWRSLLEDLKVKKTSEEDELKSHQEAIQKEKNNLAVELADFKARVTQLERELEAYKKSQKYDIIFLLPEDSKDYNIDLLKPLPQFLPFNDFCMFNRKSERKALFLERKLEHIQDREITAQETLAQVLRVVRVHTKPYVCHVLRVVRVPTKPYVCHVLRVVHVPTKPYVYHVLRVVRVPTKPYVCHVLRVERVHTKPYVCHVLRVVRVHTKPYVCHVLRVVRVPTKPYVAMSYAWYVFLQSLMFAMSYAWFVFIQSLMFAMSYAWYVFIQSLMFAMSYAWYVFIQSLMFAMSYAWYVFLQSLMFAMSYAWYVFIQSLMFAMSYAWYVFLQSLMFAMSYAWYVFIQSLMFAMSYAWYVFIQSLMFAMSYAWYVFIQSLVCHVLRVARVHTKPYVCHVLRVVRVPTKPYVCHVLRVAEKTAEERDSYEKFAKSQTYEQKKVASIIRQGDINIMGLQERLKESKKKSNRKMANVTERLEEKDKEINSIKEHYERELNNLRALLREKNKQIEVMQGERRQVEEELDLVWQKADYDNKHMMESIRPSPRT
ncbi:predicted protein [Nematostella vectensis]|uniref:Uncharacterized protein n=1 Tax=Nematostella vectensis TaxID=45351 RepID=A7RRE3_NEMVE|nr:predicted protein [Nematostella vectensis]|eukprot:XP_001637994.1 predicted protein [Nematostella vectensis]